MLEAHFHNKYITEALPSAHENEAVEGLSQSSPVDTWQRFNPFNNHRKAKITDDIQSEKTFRLILRRERARSDRNGHGFCLVTFQLDGFKQDQASLRRLLHALARRGRLTDQIGLCDKNRIGVLLYDTSSEGASTFVKQVEHAVSDTSPSPRFQVFNYPSDWR